MTRPKLPGKAHRRGLLLALAGLGWPGAGARAHALVTASDPRAGARLATAPAKVSLRFNSRIDHERSRLSLIAEPPPGRPAPPPLTLEIAQGTEATVVEAPCPPLEPGAWRLRWQVLAVDGHITRGDIPFRIGESPAAAR